MATYKAPKTISKRTELRKDAATTVFVRIQDFFSDYRQYILYSGIAAAALAVGIISYVYVQGTRSQQANELLGGIIMYYERGEFRTALDGAGEDLGLVDIVDDYGSTEAGNLARFYAADAAFRLGEYDQSLEWFENFRGDGGMLEASALDGQAAIYEMREDYQRAGALYERAADVYDSELRSPEYLMKAARALRKQGAYEDAEAVLLQIREDYPDSEYSEDMDFHLGYIRAKLK